MKTSLFGMGPLGLLLVFTFTVSLVMPSFTQDDPWSGFAKLWIPGFALGIIAILMVNSVRFLLSVFRIELTTRGEERSSPSQEAKRRARLFFWHSVCFLLELGASGFLISYFATITAPAAETWRIERAHMYLGAGTVLALLRGVIEHREIEKQVLAIKFTALRVIFLVYALMPLVSAMLFMMPWALFEHGSMNFTDALFIATSALTVTGLSPLNITQALSPAGVYLLLFLIQVGGMGFVAISGTLVFLSRGRPSIHHSNLAREMFSLDSMAEFMPYLIRMVAITLTIEALGAFFLYASLPSETPMRALHAVFHAISAFCNAGFSSLPTGLEMPGHFALKTGIMVLIVTGGIGFPVISEVSRHLVRRGKRWRALTLHTRVVLVSFALLFCIGTLGLTLLDRGRIAGHKSIAVSFFDGMFYSVSARTAGFNLADFPSLGAWSFALIFVLMIIGGSPVSTSGGLKTTTVAVPILAAASYLKGLRWIEISQSEVPLETLQKAVTIIILYFAFLTVASLVLIGTHDLPPERLVFEAASALSTVGLTVNITPSLSAFGKCVVMLLMVTGRIGFLAIILAATGDRRDQKFHYAQERLFVG